MNRAIYLLLPLLLAGTTMPTSNAALPDFDKLWNYSDPAGTERKFRELLPQAESSNDPSYLAQLLTQIARAQGLQDQFEQAYATLDQAERLITPDLQSAKVRLLLERGRVLNSSGKPTDALPLFKQSAELAKSAKLTRLQIDAVHMIAIAETDPKDQVRENLRAISLVESDPSQSRWLYPLYNNLAESYAKLNDYQKALDTFRNLADLDTVNGREPDMFAIKDQARMLRLLGRIDEAITLIKPLAEKLAGDNQRDGWICEEYAECLLAQHKDAEAVEQFRLAHDLLSQDPWVKKHDPAKLDRLRRLSKGP